MVAATVLEKLRGADAARDWVYHSPWFMLLWGIAAAAGMALLFRRGISRQVFTTGLHLGFVCILAGALTTHLGSESGQLHLRKGEETTSYLSEDGTETPLGFGLRLERFTIEYYPGTRQPMDYRSEVTLLPEGISRTISMNRILKWNGYRFYQADYDADRRGSILAVSHDPWGVGITYAGYILLMVCMTGFFFQKGTAFREHGGQVRLPRRLQIGLFVAGAALLLGCAWLICRKWLFEPLLPVLRSPLLWIHVSCMIIAYTLFALVAFIGVAGLFRKEESARKQLQACSLVLLCPPVFLLTSGTFLGAVWANLSWGCYWTWDPKETWALITLLIYATALHGRSLAAFRRPGFFHAYCVLAFLSVLITYFGVNLLLGGLHAYADIGPLHTPILSWVVS
ncbi:MAG: cytochrome c biogenesis protein CcsA [Bacteroidales bacterium]|nr:cytochrome c biogenesis protein CcsA [Bacteroidales bacterium]